MHFSFIQKNTHQSNEMRLVSLSETSLWDSLRRDGKDRQWQLEAKGLNQISSLLVNLQLTLSVRKIQSGNLWNVLVLSLTLLLLKLERDTSNWTLLNSLHQVGGVTGNLVSESLRWDLSNLSGQSLVSLEIESELWVVTLNQNLGGSLDGFSSNTTL